MRTPNTECCVCGKPLYRRPKELARVRHVACLEHRNEAQERAGLTAAQLIALALGRRPGTNNRTGYKHRDESKRKASQSHKRWCAEHADLVKARGEKTRGAKHYNWKGGSSRLNTAIRRMTENRNWMDAVVRRDGVCQKCGTNVNLEAHHVEPFAEILARHGITKPEQARVCGALWDLSNGITLCESCHCEHHGRAYTPTGNGRRKSPRKVRRPMTGEANPNYKGGRVVMTCPQCGATFYVKPAEVLKRKCCSRKCLGASQRKHA